MSNSEISILCLIGLPASGKTLLASLIAKHKLGFTEALHFCYDDFIRWEKTEDKFTWKHKRRNVFIYVESKILSFLEKVKFNKSLLIILDDNMYYRSMRYEFYKLARKYKIKFCQIYVETSIITCLERNSCRASPLYTNQILNINEKLETPLFNNSWEKNTLTICGEENVGKYLNKVKILIDSAEISIELEERSKERKKVQNPKHTADLALRRIISLLAKEMKANGECNMIEKMSELNKKRNYIMGLIDKDKFQLPCHQDIEIYIQHLFNIMTVK